MSPIPSRFIEELPDEHIAKHGQQGLSSVDQGSYNPPSSLGFNFGERHENYQLDRSKAKKSIPSGSKTIKKPAPSEFSVGQRVFHNKFGYGEVSSIDGNKLMIDFEMGSSRKVMDSFIKPAG